MRSLSEIVQANKEFEERDRNGDFDDEMDFSRKGIVENGVNRCKACDERVEDCACRLRGGNAVVPK